jgi:hypothetical protein
MQAPDTEIALTVWRWSVWPPLADSRATPEEDLRPDVSFVSAMMRRRLSTLSRMAFRVAADCLLDEVEPVRHIHCSRYGEYRRNFRILEGLAANEPVSAAAFSMSVHNTASSLFAIETKDTAPSTALAGGEATLETAFLEAWSQLCADPHGRILIVYHDETLPNLYCGQETTVRSNSAFAMLVSPADATAARPILRLGWHARSQAAPQPSPPGDPSLEVMSLLRSGGPPFTFDAGRLVWTWTRTNA